MKRTYLLGTVSRIGVFVHWTFPLLLAGLFVWYLFRGLTPTAAFTGLVVVLLLFGCVVLHELGHALVARRFGVRTLDITLYPIGGIARLEGIPKQPTHELQIALAGPAVNMAVAACLFVLNVTSGRPLSLNGALGLQPNLLGTLMWLNVGLAAFNMIPAFPMDGGRVLRAGLATKMSFRRATQIAAIVGQGIAVLFVLYGISTFNPILVLIAFMVFAGARQEVRQLDAE